LKQQSEQKPDLKSGDSSLSASRPRLQTLRAGDSQSLNEEEINLFDLLRVLLDKKWIIIAVAGSGFVFGIIYALQKPNIYRAEAVVAPVGGKAPSGSEMLLGRLGGLASMAGLSGGNSSNAMNLAMLKSRVFIKNVIRKNRLMPALFPEKWDQKKNDWIKPDPEKQPTLWDGFRLLKKNLNVSTDKKTGLTTISLIREDPEQAALWLNILIADLNDTLKERAIKEADANIEYMSKQIRETPLVEMRQSLYNIIAEQTQRKMLAKAQPYYAFKIIDPPEIPDKKAGPRRAIIVIMFTLAAGIFAVFLVFFLEFLKKQAQIQERTQE